MTIGTNATASDVKEALFAKCGVHASSDSILRYGDHELENERSMVQQGFPSAVALAAMASAPVLTLEQKQPRRLPFEMLSFDAVTVVPASTVEIPSWSPHNSHVVSSTEEANFRGKAPLLSNFSSVRQAAERLNAEVGLCIPGICIVFSKNSGLHVLLWRSDKAEEVEYKFSIECSSRKWSVENTHDLCAAGEDFRVQGHARFLDHISSVSEAVEQLNDSDGQMCPEGICVVFSQTNQRFFLLYRDDKRQIALFSFDIEEKPSWNEATVQNESGSCPKLRLWPDSKSELRFNCSRFAPVSPLDDAARAQRVPHNAHLEAFVYPPQNGDSAHAPPQLRSLLVHGGFAYLSEHGALLRVNALSPNQYGAVHFGPRHGWRFGADVLRQAGLVQPVPRKAPLALRHARHLCWVTPGERISSAAVWRDDVVGLVFLFNEDATPHVADCCFVRQEPFQEVADGEFGQIEEYLRVFGSPWEELVDGEDRSAESIARIRLQCTDVLGTSFVPAPAKTSPVRATMVEIDGAPP